MRSGLYLPLRAAGMLALALVAAMPLRAQRNAPDHGGRDESPLAKQIAAETGQAASDYWTPRLNDYKTRIDATLSSADLETLNRLRVRWAILMDEGMQAIREKKNGSSVKDGEMRLEMKLDDDGAAKLTETMEIFASAKELAARYRAGLDELAGTVATDVGEFAGMLADRGDRFAAENPTALASDAAARKMVEGRNGLRKFARKMEDEKSRRELGMIYSFAIEPIILLYNGADLAKLFDQASPITKPISGIALPEASALKQNFPNPASATTRIPYKVSEPSSSAVIRLFDAKGDLMGTYDQGARTVGEYEMEVNVADLPTGSYLYHLTLQTDKGPRVYSRTMQVVH